jgi:hypothetical protein
MNHQSMTSYTWNATKGDRLQPMVCKHRELHGCNVRTTRGKQEKVTSRKLMSPLGWPLSVPRMFRWPIEEMCTDGRRTTNHWETPLITIQRPLWSVPHTSQNLAVWILLANDVWGHQRIRSEVLEMSISRRHNSMQCDAPTLQSRNIEIFDVWGVDYMRPF